MGILNRIYNKLALFSDLDLIPLAANSVRWRSYKDLLNSTVYKIEEVDFAPSPLIGWIHLSEAWRLALEQAGVKRPIHSSAFKMILNKRGKILRLKCLNIEDPAESLQVSRLVIALHIQWYPALKNKQPVNVDMDFSL